MRKHGMRRTPVCLLIGVIALIGCNTPPKEFAVSDVPVYAADNLDQLFMPETAITIKFADSEPTFAVGDIKNGRITFSLPDSVPKEFFDNPDYLAADTITSGLDIATVIFFPDIYVYDVLNQREYRPIYASKNGSFALDGVEYNLNYGWNLIAQKEKPLNASKTQYSLQYKWVCDTDTSAQYYMEAAKNRFNEERFKSDSTPKNTPREKDWWEDQ